MIAVLRHWLAVLDGPLTDRWPAAVYAVRPYDMLADARRWRWQPAQRCGWYSAKRRAGDAS